MIIVTKTGMYKITTKFRLVGILNGKLFFFKKVMTTYDMYQFTIFKKQII